MISKNYFFHKHLSMANDPRFKFDIRNHCVLCSCSNKVQFVVRVIQESTDEIIEYRIHLDCFVDYRNRYRDFRTPRDFVEQVERDLVDRGVLKYNVPNTSR